MKNLKRGLGKQSRHSVRSHIEPLEHRQLLSAVISTSSSLMVFNAVKGSTSTTQTLTLTDTGDAPLSLGSGAFSLFADSSSPTNDTARFTLLNKSSAPSSLSPGQSFGLNISFNANAVITNAAILDVATNDPNHSVDAISLHGIGTKGLGGSNQPSLATILRAYDIPTIVGEGHNDSNAATDGTYPYPPDASSQETVMQSFVKAGTGPVTIDVLASFTASGFSKSYQLGTYSPGNPNSLSELFYTSSSENQTTVVHPLGATTFDPASNPFGFYFVSNVQVKGRIGYSEDALNTWDSTTGRHFRFFPMENPDGSVQPNTYIMSSTEWNAPVGYDFTNIVAVVHNIKAAPDAPGAPVIGLQNMNPLPGSNRMIFNTIQVQNPTYGDTAHNTGVLKINNTGNSPLVISSYSLSSGWVLSNPPAFPLTVGAKSSTSLTIKFVQSTVPSHPYNETNDIYEPQYGGVVNGTLTLYSNDPNHPSSSVPLAGWFQTHSENSEEPSLQTMVNLLAGWTTNINPSPIPDLKETTTTNGSPTYYGEEVVSPYWMEADPLAGVTVQQFAAFHTQGNTATTSWYPQGKPGSTSKLFNTANDYGQSFFPFAGNSAAPATATFSSTGAFGFKCDSDYTDDALNAGSEGGGHHMRFFPVRDAGGALVPNTYLMTMDYTVTPENFDFQDNVWIVSNIRPSVAVSGISGSETSAAPATPNDFHAAGTSGGVSLQWAPVQDSTLRGYNISRSTSENGSYTLLTPSPISATSYVDTSTSSGTTYFYKVTAFDYSLGTNSMPAISSTTALSTGASTTTPATPANFTATGYVGGISLSWSTVNDPTLGGYYVYSSSSASGTYKLLSTQPANSTSYPDSTAPVGATTYYQIRAFDGASGFVSNAASASATALSAVTGLQSIDIGATPSGSTTVVNAGTDFNVTAGGPGVAGTVDGFRYIYQTQTGNFDVKVQVTSLTVAGNYSTAGILARSSLTTTSPDVYMSASPINYRFKERSSDGGVNNIVVGPSTTIPNAWVRLSRVGNLFTGYYSSDGVHWTTLSTITLALPTTLNLGLAVASNVTTATTTAQLRGYGPTSVTAPTPPPTPGSLTATGITNAVSLSWAAVSDSTLKGYNVYSSSSASGTYKLLTNSPITATSFTDSSAPVGVVTYYHVTAVDASSGLESSPASASATAQAVVVTGLQSIDIGATPAGSTTVVTPGTDFNVTAGGPGVAGYADGFRYIYQSQTGDFDVKVQVTSLTVAGNYSTAGILARSALTTTSPDVYMSASPINYRFKERSTTGGVNNIVVGPSTTLPNAWVRLSRSGNLFTGYYSTDGTNWTTLSSISLALPSTLNLGLAVASNVTTMTTTARLRGYGDTTAAQSNPPAAPTGLTATGVTNAVSLKWNAVSDDTLKGYNVYSSGSANGAYTLLTNSPITATSFSDTGAPVGMTTYYRVTAVDASSGLESTPASASATATAAGLNLTSVDIGASPSGSTTVVTPGSAYNVTAGGPGVIGTSDGFRFLYTQAAGDFDVKVQVASITVAGNFATAGIMARSTLDAASANVYMSATPANFRFKDRPTDGAATAIAVSGTPSYPNVWVRLQRIGDVFNGYTSTDGSTWSLMSSVSVALPSTLNLGLAVASNVDTATTTAALQNYSNT